MPNKLKYHYLKVSVSNKFDDTKKVKFYYFFVVAENFFNKESAKQKELIEKYSVLASNEIISHWEKAPNTDVEKYNFYRLGLATKTIQADQAEIFFISSILP